jgi:hypothetical protein
VAVLVDAVEDEDVLLEEVDDRALAHAAADQAFAVHQG